MIYTRFGSPVSIVQAERRTIYIERLPGEIRHHDDGPPANPKGEVHTCPETWFARIQYAADLEDGSASVGDWACGGGWIKVAESLRADDGWREIDNACRAAETAVA